MELVRDEGGLQTYRSRSVEEEPQRVELVSVRMPVSQFFTGSELLKQKVHGLSSTLKHPNVSNQ
jgi:hypothetical protein